MNSFFRFFVYSNLFIATCAVLMINQTYQLLLHVPPNRYFLAFVFSATIASYSFHWYLTTLPEKFSSRSSWLRRHRKFHLVLFFIGITASAFFALYFIEYWRFLLFSVLLTFLYSAPKLPHRWFRALLSVAIGKTIFLAMVWMYVTTILPIAITGNEWSTEMILFCIGRFFFIYAICIMFDYRDREEDKAEGIRSMITYFSEKGIDYLFFVSLFVFAVATILLWWFNFSTTDVILILIPGIIIALIYRTAKKNFSDVFYYFILDGLMMLSALLMLVIK
jgi:4-hydroxybenzoate polyprenyltransferase